MKRLSKDQLTMTMTQRRRAQKEFEARIAAILRRADAMRDFVAGKPTLREVDVRPCWVRRHHVGGHTRLIQTTRRARTVSK